jgi:large subunit ribosomal protein L9
MQVILLEKHKKLGNVGDVASVRDGFARNFLIPNKKAMQATKENVAIFEQRKETIHKEIAKKQSHAEKIREKLDNQWVYILKQAGEDGRLYGSINSSELINVIKEQFKSEDLNKNNIRLLKPIKSTGPHDVSVNIFADIFAKVNLMVARTKEEAETQIQDILSGKHLEKKEKAEVELAAALAEAKEESLAEDVAELATAEEEEASKTTKRKTKSKAPESSSEE